MRMPIFGYFAVVGVALLALLILSSWELPTVGSPIKTSQVVGISKVEPRPDRQPLVTTFNFAREKENVAEKPANAVENKDAGPRKRKDSRARAQDQASKDPGAPREHRVAAYPHDDLMGIH